MATGRKSQKAGRGIPRKAGSANRKRRYELYRLRTICRECRLAFSSPRKRKAHQKEGHSLRFSHQAIPISESTL